ncbi:uncharacterized protein TRAVEDRAFT_42798 [Trametes versicolor FP-101664 SS1]|uniref:uncharacterized protein n=1 Tax=Trametes versicolor (strain FP-101664) TaxID=717944 RepID=UPI00046217E5|nr:uncharacterized protein TRAVEDRAFT_42798 [Trametes versicolor FP-101664 SS1]EIW62430.1 hypothetical protein TRAVEDRAFT_42798 [Trametes versicolor FP-101664 SS1]
MVAYPQWPPGDCADSVSQSSCSIKEGVSNTIASPTPPQLTHHSSLVLDSALDSSAAPMPPDLQAPHPRGRSHLPRRTDKPLINLLSTSYQPLSALATAGHRSMFTWKSEAERVQAQADAEYALLLHPETLAWRFQTTGRKLARYVGEGKKHLFTVNHPYASRVVTRPRPCFRRTVERVPYDPSGPSSR